MLTALYGPRYDQKTRGNNIASEIHHSNHVILYEEASTRVTDTCKGTPDISITSSSIAMNIDWHTEYAIGSEHLAKVLSIICKLIITHKTPQRTFIKLRTADWASLN